MQSVQREPPSDDFHVEIKEERACISVFDKLPKELTEKILSYTETSNCCLVSKQWEHITASPQFIYHALVTRQHHLGIAPLIQTAEERFDTLQERVAWLISIIYFEIAILRSPHERRLLPLHKRVRACALINLCLEAEARNLLKVARCFSTCFQSPLGAQLFNDSSGRKAPLLGGLRQLFRETTAENFEKVTLVNLHIANLTRLPREIGGFSNARKVYIQFNELVFLPAKFVEMFPKVEYIDLRNNHLMTAPQSCQVLILAENNAPPDPLFVEKELEPTPESIVQKGQAQP